ncbi:hypothetical protein H4582DRAFT_746360 [Lactarius indigo]|nr:hypothetical protein H4582DRAFT_746360 [Lactarius indigo]
MRVHTPFHLPITTNLLSSMPFKLFSRKKRTSLATSQADDRPPAQGTTIVPDPARQIDTHDDITMNAIQTSLALLKEGSSLATKFPFIAPIAGLLLQALTMRDEVKQYKRECEIVMGKLARIAGIIVNVCEKYNLSEEELPNTLRDILSSLQRFVSFVTIARAEPHDLTKDQRVGQDREGAKEVLEEKGYQRGASTQGSVDEYQAM